MKKILALMLVLLLFLGCTSIALQALAPKYDLQKELSERVPGELLRYTLMRLEGHPNLEAIAHPLLHPLQRSIEQPVPFPLIAAQQMGKGQQPISLPEQRYSSKGLPEVTSAAVVHAAINPISHKVQGRELIVVPGESLAAAMQQAQTGDTITLKPGNYFFGGYLKTVHPGKPEAPIVVRGEVPGTVHVHLSSGLFYVNQPYWVFENLHIKGDCKDTNGPCEHAFHIVGSARGTVIRNNHLHNFFAHIKVNGLDGIFPNGGIVQFNTFSNDENYGLKGSLTPFDLVAASRWNVADNLFHHFVKAWSPHASYGIFMKGGGSYGRIERNFVVCTSDGKVSHHGSRVGISLGGGLTGREFCPDKTCIYEHADGLVANNIVMHCNDFGIDVNRSIRSLIAHNTLINTYGIDVRDIPSSALTYGNYLGGSIIAKRGGEVTEEHNDKSLRSTDAKSENAGISNRLVSTKIIPTHPLVKDDYCGRTRNQQSNAGALITDQHCWPQRNTIQ